MTSHHSHNQIYIWDEENGQKSKNESNEVIFLYVTVIHPYQHTYPRRVFVIDSVSHAHSHASTLTCTAVCSAMWTMRQYATISHTQFVVMYFGLFSLSLSLYSCSCFRFASESSHCYHIRPSTLTRTLNATAYSLHFFVGDYQIDLSL